MFNRPNHFNFFKDCLPQIVLGQFLNALSHIDLVMKQLRNNT